MRYRDFELDRFQEEAIRAIDAEHSVIVAAPTGAGKTVIAEYAIEKYIREGKEIIYTAPIKALSNQKYRDFTGLYGDKIGIITGDVLINHEAPVLLMTTEIFRNIIFDDPTRLDHVEHVIFDEIHYINDIERGTVWEESIIFAPQHIKFICLSATIPNLQEFADWMRNVREIPIDVVEETHRPVPLEYHLFLNGFGIGDLNSLKRIQEDLNGNRYTMKRNWEDFQEEVPRMYTEREMLERFGIVKADLLDYIKSRGQIPCLYFSFGRQTCEEMAQMHSNLDLLSQDEKEELIELYDSLCEKFSVYDDKGMRHLIENGVAYHHAGMLPTLKEVVEQLFTSGLIKLLFTTETFAMGVNMPACSVVFGSLEKFDGVNFRYLKAREYHQMAGRAGRRGIDTRGYVYACVNPYFDKFSDVKRIIQGKIEKIESQFSLSYSSILNLYSKHREGIYEVCIKSFGNYQAVGTVDVYNRRIGELKKTLSNMEGFKCVHDAEDQIWRYLEIEEKIKVERSSIKQERREISRTLRGRRNKRLRTIERKKLYDRLNKLEAQRRKMICHKCPRRDECLNSRRGIQNIQEKIERLKLQQERVQHHQANEIQKRLDCLRELGYIDDGGLTPRGLFASQIFGYEMQVTELFFDGYFHRLTEDEINALAMAIVFESRKGDWYKKLKHGRLKAIFADAEGAVKRIRDTEKKCGIFDLTRELDTKFSEAAYEWSRGCRFERLTEYTSASEGDIVRSLRLVIDLVRQIRRAVGREDRALRDKLSRCIDRMHRDVVDAERQLRLGSEAAALSRRREVQTVGTD
ncbi:MAG: DEAD/DEAH box helicase [bacterium]